MQFLKMQQQMHQFMKAMENQNQKLIEEQNKKFVEEHDRIKEEQYKKGDQKFKTLSLQISASEFQVPDDVGESSPSQAVENVALEIRNQENDHKNVRVCGSFKISENVVSEKENQVVKYEYGSFQHQVPEIVDSWNGYQESSHGCFSDASVQKESTTAAISYGLDKMAWRKGEKNVRNLCPGGSLGGNAHSSFDDLIQRASKCLSLALTSISHQLSQRTPSRRIQLLVRD